MTRVFIADDHAVVRIGLRHVLIELGGFRIVGEADNGRGVLNAPELRNCDVLVLDLSLPVVSGMEVLRRVRAEYPTLGVVVHSMHPESQFRRRAFEAGAVAYISKESPPSMLIDAIRRAALDPFSVQSQPSVPESSLAEEPAKHTLLTRREHQIFMLIVMGRQVADIAAELDVHSCTVSNHLAKIRKKLGVTTATDIVRYAYAEGLIDLDPMATS